MEEVRRHSKIVGVCLIIFLAAAFVFSSNFSWYEPKAVYLSIEGINRHIADTWQEWRIVMTDGSTQVKRSGSVGIWGPIPFELLPSTPLYAEITVPIQFLISLPKGDPLPLAQTVPAWYYALLVRETIDVYLQTSTVTEHVGKRDAINYPDLVLTYTSLDDPGKVVNFKFRILLSGSYPSVLEAGFIMPLDLRDRVKQLDPTKPFTLSVGVYQTWDLTKYCNPGGKICAGQLAHVDEYLQFKIDITVLMASLTAPFTIPLPTQTFLGTVTTRDRTVVVVITQIVPSVSTIYTGQGWTATVRGNGTTIVTTVTETPPPLPVKCEDWFPSWLCDPFAWLKATTTLLGVTLANWQWILIGVGVVMLLWLLSKFGSRRY